MNDLQIERLTEEHIPEIMAIEQRAYTAPWSDVSFRAELTNHMAVYLVLKQNGRMIGYAGEWLVIDEAHITTLAVAPERQRKGFGEVLLIELLVQAVQAGMTRATLEVRMSNEAAQKLYEKYGFKTVAIRKAYYSDREDACVMWLNELGKADYRTRLGELRKECFARARSRD